MPRMNDNEEFWRDSCELGETMSSLMQKKGDIVRKFRNEHAFGRKDTIVLCGGGVGNSM